MEAIPSGEGGDPFPLLLPPPQNRRIWGGSGQRRRRRCAWRRTARERGGRVGGWGRKGAYAGPGNALVVPAPPGATGLCRASACGATEVPRHCPVSAAVAQRCAERQHGSPVVPHALARQRLLVVPGALA